MGSSTSKVTHDVTNTIAQLPDLVESLTGIGILGTLKNLPSVMTLGNQTKKVPRVEQKSPHKNKSLPSGLSGASIPITSGVFCISDASG